MLGIKRVVTMLPVQDLERARRFYVDSLGLSVEETESHGILLKAGSDAWLAIYERPPVHTEHTAVAFDVESIESTMRDLRRRGVTFEDYDLPGMKTEDGVATGESGDKGAWFKDPDGNILGVRQEASFR